MALLAALGGMILNLMPCVFPVLSLKVLGIAAKGGNGHGKALHGLAYAAGVVLSFVAVAGLLLALRGAGAAIGWGFHLQSPAFVAALAYLFVVMGLALSGMINLGSGVMGSGEALARQGGYRGTFFTGVLATVVASPCSAPFMGTALGFAMTQPPVYALAIFAALGLGMAAPFVLLTLSPALLRRLPHPGPWMDGFKQFLAFPLYAAAVWLLWVLGNQTGVNGMAAVTGGCVLLALGLWCWEHAKLHRRPLPLRLLGRADLRARVARAALAACSTSARPCANRQHPRVGGLQPGPAGGTARAGTPVFVNVTADWCITCLANERIALASDQRCWRRFATAASCTSRVTGPTVTRNSRPCCRRTGAAACRSTCYYPPGSRGPGHAAAPIADTVDRAGVHQRDAGADPAPFLPRENLPSCIVPELIRSMDGQRANCVQNRDQLRTTPQQRYAPGSASRDTTWPPYWCCTDPT
jgi:thiol:disulfide interchange protein